MDPNTLSELAHLRRQIDMARGAAGRTLTAMSSATSAAAATPFLADCAKELEALAGVCRAAADQGVGVTALATD